MNKSQIFKAAHALAKSAHVAGDCYRVTFGAALKIVIAESKAPKSVVKVSMNAWKKGGNHRLYAKVLNVADARFGTTFDDEVGYIDVKTGEVKFLFHAFTTVNAEMILAALNAYIANLKATDDEDWAIEYITSATLKIEV
jgi:hypothetical protein